jgi:hypothetical protein
LGSPFGVSTVPTVTAATDSTVPAISANSAENSIIATVKRLSRVSVICNIVKQQCTCHYQTDNNENQDNNTYSFFAQLEHQESGI